MRAVRQQQALGARGLEGGDRLVRREVTPRLAVELGPLEGRLAEKEIAAPGKLRQPLARTGIARVGERVGAVRDPESVRLQRVVREPKGEHFEPRRRERLAFVVLAQAERLLEHVRLAEPRPEQLELLAPAGRHPELGRILLAGRADHQPPDPGNEVAPVIEVEVADDDRVDARPAVGGVQLPQPRQDARTAVEQQSPRALDQIAGLSAAGVRPGGRRAHDGQFHIPILPEVAGKIRVVIAKPGLDGHDRGAKIIARALRDAGMEVIYTGLHQTPDQIVETAIQEDADAVGISILSGAHMTLVPRILDLLKENGAEDVLVVLGGTIPREDADELREQGVAAVFTPGAPTSEIVDFLRDKVGAAT